MRSVSTPTLLLVATLVLFAVGAAAAKTCKDLHDAVEQTDLATVKFLIGTKKCSPNLKRAPGGYHGGYNPLHVALDDVFATGGFSHPYNAKQVALIRYLLAKGVNVNTPFPDYAGVKGYTPLHYAAYDGNMILVPLFVKYGAKVNARDSRGFTPLHSAAKCDFRLSCDDCTPRPKPKRIPSSTLSKLGAKPVISFLLSKKANILAVTKERKTVLDYVPTPCAFPASSCKEFKVSRCSLLCSAKYAKLTWPTGSCRYTYFYVKGRLAAAKKKRPTRKA